ncbi:hypothetical protein TNCV_636101 [Trichonephila clavipes]|nr:hypothetical protein TNCV_636101 [Trichonephila clavipes]
MVKVTNSSPVCHEFETNIAEDPQCRGGRYMSNMSRFKWCDVVGEWSASSGGVLVTRPWFKFTRSIAESPLVAE